MIGFVKRNIQQSSFHINLVEGVLKQDEVAGDINSGQRQCK